MLYDLDEELYSKVVNLIEVKNESDTVKYYKEKASVVDDPNSLFTTTPESLLEKDIDEHQEWLKTTDDASKLKFLRTQLYRLKAARKFFSPKRLSEHKILEHDFFIAKRHPFVQKQIYEDEQVKDYNLDGERMLRLRLLHPDRDEHILGADLIYEIFDLVNERVRFVHLQYKTWDKGVLYLKQGNIKDQLNKMQSNLCSVGFCKSEIGNNHSDLYRMPFCCGFLRPTEKLQMVQKKLKSSGIHLPICEVMKNIGDDDKITKSNSKGRNISSTVFSELFIENIIGSRWHSMNQLEEYYEKRDIESLYNNIRIHAQEFPILSDEDYARK